MARIGEGGKVVTGLSPSLASYSKELELFHLHNLPSLDYNSLSCDRDFKFELFPLHSPLLRESLLVSFPPLTDMLKFSGSSCLI